MSKIRIVLRSLSLLVVVLTVVSMLSCVAAIPVAVMYYKSTKHYVARAEMPIPADKVYRTAVSMAEERAPDLKILKKDDSKLLLEVTDGTQTGSLKAVPISDEKTEIIITTDVPADKEKEEEKKKKKEREKELALRVIDQLCTRLDVKCTITKQ